jgi:hypothetical protein
MGSVFKIKFRFLKNKIYIIFLLVALITSNAIAQFAATSFWQRHSIGALPPPPQTTLTMCSTAIQVVGFSSGNIVDSGGPLANYADAQDCRIIIHGDSVPSSIMLTFDSFDTEGGYDIFEVYDGVNEMGTLLGSFSGSSLPGSVIAASGTMFIKWSSDGSTNGAGFEAHWGVLPATMSWTSPSIYSMDAGSSEYISAASGTGPFNFSVLSGAGSINLVSGFPSIANFQASSTPGSVTVRLTDSASHTYDDTISVVQSHTLCNQTSSTLSTGSLYDPGGPASNYNDSLDCGFLIQPAAPGTSIKLFFDYFNIEGGYDTLEIYDGTNSSGTLIGTYTGFVAVPVITATSGSVYLHFNSDSNTNFDGFRLTWKVF